MDIVLKPELAAFVAERVKTGAYDNASDVVNEALSLLKQHDEHDPLEDLTEEELAELRQEIQIGIDELDRGEGIVLEGKEALTAFFDDVKTRGRERLRSAR